MQKSYIYYQGVDTLLWGRIETNGGIGVGELRRMWEIIRFYAHHVGFSVCKLMSKKTREGSHKYKYYVYSKLGNLLWLTFSW